MCPNASMMPSLARMRLATASSWRNSANASGMALVPLAGIQGKEERIALRRANGVAQCVRYAPVASRCSSTSDGGEEVGKLFLDLLSQLGAGAGDHRKVGKPLGRPAGVYGSAGIGLACRIDQRVERSAPSAANEREIGRGIAARADSPH